MIRQVCFIVLVSTLVQTAAGASGKQSQIEKDWKTDSAAAHAAYQVNDFAKAEKLAKKAMRETRLMRPNDPRVLQSTNELGQIYLRQRKFDHARPYFMRILKYKEAKYGKDSAALIQPLNDVVRVTCAGGACYDTIPYLKRLLAIRKRVEPKSRDIPITLLLIGEAYEKREAYPEAMDYFKQATLAEKERTGSGPMVATLARNIERVRREMAVCKN